MNGVGLSANFMSALRGIDSDLRACLDPSQDAIVIWSERMGRPKIHEFTSFRVITEESDIIGSDGKKLQKEIVLKQDDLESFTLRRLKEIDTWRIHGDGKSFDNWLYDKEETYRAAQKRKSNHERREYLKEHKSDFNATYENLRRGIVHENQQRPFTRSQMKRLMSRKGE